MSKGRPASLPPGGRHQRPAVLSGLVVTHVNEKGTRSAEYDFARLPLTPEFRLEWATVFARRANPTGAWRNLPSSKQGYWAISYFARWLAKRERVPRSIAELDAATWLEWRLGQAGTTAARRAVRLTRMLLLESELLTHDTRRVVSKRAKKDQATEASYDEDELRALTVAARRIWRIARDRIRANKAHLRAYRAGQFALDTDEELLGRALDRIAVDGDVPRTNWHDRAPVPWASRALGGGHRDRTWKRLYLDDAEVMAALVLLACKEGWNQTSIQELKVPERIDGGSAQPVYRVELEKRRRRPPHRYETRTLTDSKPDSTARLLGQIIEVTQPARDALSAHGLSTDRLLVGHRVRSLGGTAAEMFQLGVGGHARENFRLASGQTVNLRRVRKAVNNRHRREPNQNSRETHESIYLLRDPQTISDSEDLIARGLERAVEHARTGEVTVETNDSDWGMDTPTSACVDVERSPFSPWGVPCTASFLLCLACHNAVVMPKHLGRLAYLYECLNSRRTSLPPDVWVSEWQAHFERLHSLRTEYYNHAQWQSALDTLTDADRATVDHLLKGNLDA